MQMLSALTRCRDAAFVSNLVIGELILLDDSFARTVRVHKWPSIEDGHQEKQIFSIKRMIIAGRKIDRYSAGT